MSPRESFYEINLPTEKPRATWRKVDAINIEPVLRYFFGDTYR